MDILEELQHAHRRVHTQEGDAGVVHRVEVERRYAAAVEDVWEACTSPERLSRWFLPVTGELRPGGRYQLEGNAAGMVRECDPPHHLVLTWEYDGGTSLLSLGIAADDGGSRLRLTHDVADDEHWRTYGPGAVGVGWDLAVLGLAAHLAGVRLPEGELAATPAGQRLLRRSAASWGAAHAATGFDGTRAGEAAQRTSEAYAPGQAPAG